MRVYKTQMIVIVLFIAFFFRSGFPSLQSEDLRIFQTDKKIIIDGNLDEWSSVKEFPINLAQGGKRIDPSPDITVTARFAFDPERFYAAIKAIDDAFEFPNRSWRYGDGLYLTFIDPFQGNESDRFYTFGFSLQEDKETKVLVNRDGEYFPGPLLKDVDLKIIPDTTQKILLYEISIPWKYVIPFKPFIHDKWGINLTYVDRDHGKRKILQLYQDKRYDTEASNLRRGAIFNFISHIPEVHEFQASVNASHFYHDSEKIITSAINSPDGRSNWKILYELSSAKINRSSTEKINLNKGMNLFRFNLEIENYPSGVYVLSLGIINDKGSLKFREDMQFFVLNRDEFDELNSKLVEAKDKEPFKKDIRYRESLPTLEIRLEWVKQYMDESPPFADIKSLELWFQEIDILYKNVDEGKPALFFPGEIGRLAHRSKIDNSLQPYSVFIPFTYDEKKPIPLFVTLHGSGIDERKTIYSVSRMILRRGNFIVLAPKARGLSDWYLGDSGKDVIECINHLKKLYNIDEKNIILDGFSMGGYGAWRLGLLHPELFKAVIIKSGAVSPPLSLKGENIIDLLDRGKGVNFFIVHGDKDNAVSVENSRKAVQRLKELGIPHTYLEVKDAAHGGYDKWNEIFRWLNRIVKKS
jgi:predicted esterase